MIVCARPGRQATASACLPSLPAPFDDSTEGPNIPGLQKKIGARLGAKAKAAGVYKGRPASIDAVGVRELKSQGLGATDIARALGIGRASLYRVLKAAGRNARKLSKALCLL